MSEMTVSFVVGVRCVKCGAEERLDPMVLGSSLRPGLHSIVQDLQDLGWAMFVGRSRRAYCPDHRPTGDTMRRVW